MLATITTKTIADRWKAVVIGAFTVALFLLGGMAALGVAIALVLSAMQGNLSYFFSPTEVVEGKAPQDRVFRVGGMVEAGSVRRRRATISSPPASMPTGSLPSPMVTQIL